MPWRDGGIEFDREATEIGARNTTTFANNSDFFGARCKLPALSKSNALNNREQQGEGEYSDDATKHLPIIPGLSSEVDISPASFRHWRLPPALWPQANPQSLQSTVVTQFELQSGV